jgi:endo-1,4-beta-xylanase
MTQDPVLPEVDRLSRRAILGAALALGACDAARFPSLDVEAQAASAGLRDTAAIPVGCCVSTARLGEPAYRDLLSRQFSQITPEWEMKVSYIAQDDGSLRFDAPDALVAFAAEHRMRVHGTTLTWYKHTPPAFQRLDGDRPAFGAAFRRYVSAVAGRYRGRVSGWDVVNEPVDDDGALRESPWTRNLGAEDHMVEAFQLAHEADPNAVLFINDYDMESRPAKRAALMRLVERLIARGAPIGGIGTQTHAFIDERPGDIGAAIRDLASFGLPVHVSELDVSFRGPRVDLRTRDQKLALQAARARETADALMALPARQRYALTLWGLRDRDSWLRSPPFDRYGVDHPLLFDDEGAPKPMYDAIRQGLGRS